ncbi:hypothetical protein [Granulibacter bethesdensis]|nr:hypothetical protein [Granulibacter bethesdensis]
MAMQLSSYASGFMHSPVRSSVTASSPEQKDALKQALLFVFAIQTPIWAALYLLFSAGL